MTELPAYDDLPIAPAGGRSAWGLFGADDNVGLFNLQTPDRVVQAARLIRKGAVFPLDMSLEAFSPCLHPRRGLPRHRVIHQPGTIVFDDVFDNFYPQVSSQWDSLGHVGYSPDSFYNGATEADVASGRRNTIEHWARRGLVGRALVFDMVRSREGQGKPYDPGTDTAFSVEDLEFARRVSGVEFTPGDILILHTGFTSWYLRQTSEVKAKLPSNYATPGLEQGEDMCRYLWDSHISAIASDTFAVEVAPHNRQAGKSDQPLHHGDATEFLHRILIGQFGMALGELWWTEDLAADCAADGVYEVFLTSMPMNAPGAIGSPPNALAIK